MGRGRRCGVLDDRFSFGLEVQVNDSSVRQGKMWFMLYSSPAKGDPLTIP